MASGQGSPTMRRRQLGGALRKLREERGITRESAAAVLGVSVSAIGNYETGRSGIRPRDLEALLDHYEVTDTGLRETLGTLAREGKRRGWWSYSASALGSTYSTYIGIEDEATAVDNYTVVTIPGLLQTESYLRALYAASVPTLPAGVAKAHTQFTDPEKFEARVRARMTRQERIMGDRPLTLHAIVDQSVLQRLVGDEEVMKEQLRTLVDASERRNVTVQVLPFTAGALGPPGAFSVIHLPDADDVVFVEGVAGDTWVESQDVDLHRALFATLTSHALSPEDSRNLIERTIEDFARGRFSDPATR